MKPLVQNKRTQALTRMEILVIIAVLAILAAMFLPRLTKKATPRYQRSTRINCVNNLKQVGLSFRLWEGDNNNKCPMSVSVTNGGAMELIADGNVAELLSSHVQQLSSPRILICPADQGHVSAVISKKDFDNSHLSYFISPDADESYPQLNHVRGRQSGRR